MSRSAFTLGRHRVAQDAEPFVIAEAGVHHFNSMALAKEYVRQCRLAGCHAIKFQTYTADRIAAKWAPVYWDEGGGRTQHDVFAERSLLDRRQYEELFAYAREVGLVLLSTPFDDDAARMLNDIGMEAFKIASADLTNHPLLEVVASFGRPVIQSTGASTFEEIDRAVDLVRSAGAPLALLHCNLAYPTPLKDANLRRIETLRERYPDLLIGYSDHTQPQDSELTCPLAVGLGARIIEKHYTLNKLHRGDDHNHAVDQAGLCRLVRGCLDAYAMTQQSVELSPSEDAARRFARRSIVARRTLAEGSVLAREDVDFKRPGTGLSPTELDRVLGRRLRRTLAADELVQLGDLVDP
jgi:N-acetylneuraminate synthase